jgi:hypothetical protein
MTKSVHAPAIKTAPAKTITRSKATPVQATQATQRAIRFHIAESFRPSAGDRLAAHTAVFLEHMGLFAGKAVPTDTARRIIGARAVKWHTDKGNMEYTSQGIMLTQMGHAAFSARNVNPEYVAAYEAVLLDGQCNDVAGVKNPAFIKAL